jgi:hypothetical protein
MSRTNTQNLFLILFALGGAEASALGQLNHARSLPQRGSVRDCA